MNTFGVILAGGGGTRFWPLSRQTSPKQLLNLSGKDLMINETIKRISGTVNNENIYIVTNKEQKEKMILATKNRIPTCHILAEPCARNTTACIAYMAIKIIKEYGDGIMCIFPSDHYIKDEEGFNSILQDAINAAGETDKLITIGIKPSFPCTGYGYIRFQQSSENEIYQVEEFKEKPNLEMARRYVDSKEYAWNSGMFVWKASVILENIKCFLPKVYDCIMKIGDSLGSAEEELIVEQVYQQIPKISIDYGVMERSKDVLMVTGDFGWNDVGSWDNLDVLYDTDENGNVIKGEQVNIDTKNCISYSQKRLITTIGVENLIIAETKDSILICSKDRAQDVKLIVDTLNSQGKYEYTM